LGRVQHQTFIPVPQKCLQQEPLGLRIQSTMAVVAFVVATLRSVAALRYRFLSYSRCAHGCLDPQMIQVIQATAFCFGRSKRHGSIFVAGTVFPNAACRTVMKGTGGWLNQQSGGVVYRREGFHGWQSINRWQYLGRSSS
jgi:hypothetical protein